MKAKVLLLFLFLQLSCIDDVTDARQQLAGSWTVDEHCDAFSYTANYSITISKSGDNDIAVANFNNSSRTLNATVNGNSITIPTQSLRTNETVSGSGNIDGNVITMTYTLVFSIGNQNCTATYTKN